MAISLVLSVCAEDVTDADLEQVASASAPAAVAVTAAEDQVGAASSYAPLQEKKQEKRYVGGYGGYGAGYGGYGAGAYGGGYGGYGSALGAGYGGAYGSGVGVDSYYNPYGSRSLAGLGLYSVDISKYLGSLMLFLSRRLPGRIRWIRLRSGWLRIRTGRLWISPGRLWLRPGRLWILQLESLCAVVLQLPPGRSRNRLSLLQHPVRSRRLSFQLLHEQLRQQRGGRRPGRSGRSASHRLRLQLRSRHLGHRLLNRRRTRRR